MSDTKKKKPFFSCGMLIFCGILFCGFSLCVYRFSGEPPSTAYTPSRSRPKTLLWYEGGTLHKKTLADWKKATDRDKLATCADFASNVTAKEDWNLKYIRRLAEELVICIDEVAKGEGLETVKISETAAGCLILMQK